MYICICVCICICIYVYVHIYIYTYMYRNTVLLHPHKRETAIESSCSTYNPL